MHPPEMGRALGSHATRGTYRSAGTTVLCPRGAFSQSPANARVGLLSASAALTDTSPNGVALIRGLAQHGYELGRNLAFERRGAEGHVDRLPRLVEELAAIKVDVIVATGYPAAVAGKQAATLPVVAYGAGDPVGTGLVESLARPGGNLTGI